MKIDRRITQQYFDVKNLSKRQFSLIMTALENAIDRTANPCAIGPDDMDEMERIRNSFRQKWMVIHEMNDEEPHVISALNAPSADD